MRSSSGADVRERSDLVLKRAGERRMSASRAVMKVSVERLWIVCIS